jgi:hypothetical protein
MRCASITCVLLIAVLATSASVCASGWDSQYARFCPRGHGCAGKKLVYATAAVGPASCGHVLTSLPGKCTVRSFGQFQSAVPHIFESSIPLPLKGGNTAPPSEPRIIISSIGSPETDRGPPRS